MDMHAQSLDQRVQRLLSGPVYALQSVSVQIPCNVNLQGYGLAWSGFREGYLLSGSDDAQICLWDINAANSKMLGAMAIYHQHLGVVEVITWITVRAPW